MKIGCVVLAAGNARRFGSNKLQVQVDGESLIRRALETVPSGLVTVVVSQYPEILSLAGEYGFEAVWNDQPDLGLSRSVPSGSGTAHGLRRGSVPRGRSAVAEAGQRRSAGRALGPSTQRRLLPWPTAASGAIPASFPPGSTRSFWPSMGTGAAAPSSATTRPTSFC